MEKKETSIQYPPFVLLEIAPRRNAEMQEEQVVERLGRIEDEHKQADRPTIETHNEG